jgi:hypothetical protein
MELRHTPEGETPLRIVGVEHEYRVSVDGRPVDFREIIHDLPVPGRRIDPGDTHAYRTETGLKVTCDGAEAEIATPPHPLSDGLVEELAAWTSHGGRQLVSLVDGRFDLDGVSTHISVSVDNEYSARASGMFSRTFAPALMLLMDVQTSPGLLVRPRRDRLEFGGEFVTGDQLGAAVMLAAGGAIVSERAAGSFFAKSKLPPPVRVDVVRAVDRFGWYVGRDAFGVDLYGAGRDTVLKREMLGTITAQQCLEESWSAAREALQGLVSEDDFRVADDIVQGRAELPLESAFDQRPPMTDRPVNVIPLGTAMTDVRTPLHTLSAVAATWDFVVLATKEESPSFVSVPTALLGMFLDEARQGIWDNRLTTSSDSATPARTLTTFFDALTLDVWSAFEYSMLLAPPERGHDGVERLAARGERAGSGM